MSGFTSAEAEHLWDRSLEGGHDDELGASDTYGWYARFNATETDGVAAILRQTPRGLVAATLYASQAEMENTWDVLVEDYAQYRDDEKEK